MLDVIGEVKLVDAF